MWCAGTLAVKIHIILDVNSVKYKGQALGYIVQRSGKTFLHEMQLYRPDVTFYLPWEVRQVLAKGIGPLLTHSKV